MAAHHAVVHHDIQPRRASPRRGGLVDDAVLEPDGGRPDGDGVVHDRAYELRSPKDLDHVDGLRDVTQARIGALAEDFLHIGIDRDDAIARPLQVARDTVAGTVRIGAEADDGNRPRRVQDLFRDVHDLRGHRFTLQVIIPQA